MINIMLCGLCSLSTLLHCTDENQKVETVMQAVNLIYTALYIRGVQYVTGVVFFIFLLAYSMTNVLAK